MSEANEERPVDPLPGLIADLDQWLAMAPQVARVVRGHYEAFVAEGFTQKQALWAAVAYARTAAEPPTED